MGSYLGSYLPQGVFAAIGVGRILELGVFPAAHLLVLVKGMPPTREEAGCLGTKAPRCPFPPRERYAFIDRRCRMGLRRAENSAMAV